jgi:hypothetical protein
MSDFEKLSVRQLKNLVRNFKKLHNISNYSKMKKLQLVNKLKENFYIENEHLYLKEEMPRSYIVSNILLPPFKELHKL